MPAALTTAQLRHAAEKLPRVPLAHLPTPLEEVKRFARELSGPRVLIKRDDCTGLAFGGNKTRHNEFILGHALEEGAETLVWGAGVQSNNCRQTAAACAKLGLECDTPRTGEELAALIGRAYGAPADVRKQLIGMYQVGSAK